MPFVQLGSLEIQTLLLTTAAYLLLSGVLIRHWSRSFGLISYGRIVFIQSILLVFGFVGAKLFFIASSGRTDGLFTLGGRVFYGSFFAMTLAMYLITRPLAPRLRFEYWNMAAKLLALGVGVGRIQCFLDGCCYGKITAGIPYVVYEDGRGAMPLLGVPVHPVQLYESAWGFVMFFLLSRLERTGMNLAFAVFLLYPAGRFILEFWRGDSIRGVSVWYGLSTGQVTSLVAIAAMFVLWSVLRVRRFGQTFSGRTGLSQNF